MSGLSRTPGKREQQQCCRGFESPLLRQINELEQNALTFFNIV